MELGYFGKFGILGSLLYGKLGVFEKLGILEVGYFEIGYFGKLGILKLQPHTHTGGFGNAAVLRRGGGSKAMQNVCLLGSIVRTHAHARKLG